MKNLSSRDLHRAMDRALAEVSRRLASGELDQSGRFYSDREARQQVRDAVKGDKQTVAHRASRRSPR
jgi:hypothetical protein